MAGCGKKMKEGGVTGRTSKRAKDDQKLFQRGYRDGLKEAMRQFNIEGKDALKDTEKKSIVEKLDKAYRGDKLGEGFSKGKSDMKAALKGQGAFKKGGKVKKGYHMMPDGKMMKDSDHKKKMKKGGKVYCKDGCAVRGKTKGRMV